MRKHFRSQPSSRSHRHFLASPSASGRLIEDATTADIHLESAQGAPVNSIGERGFAQLPNSGLIVSFCTAYFLGAAGDPSRNGPVEPHILVPDDDGGARAIEVAIQALRERDATPR